ncbi:MAG: DUF131 domain-containing protein [Candidatus Hydrothermarchaeales archaeon]
MRVNLLTLGIVVVIIGMLLIFVGILLQSLSSISGAKSEVRGGGVILIGPIPIVFGTDTGAVKAVLGLTIVIILLMIYFYTKMK